MKQYRYTITGGNDKELFLQKILINGMGSFLPVGGPEYFKSIKASVSSFKDEIKKAVTLKSVHYLFVNQPI